MWDFASAWNTLSNIKQQATALYVETSNLLLTLLYKNQC